jgi:hypothetical protein
MPKDNKTLELARSVSEHLMEELVNETDGQISMPHDMAISTLALIKAMISHLEAGNQALNYLHPPSSTA